MTLESIFMAVSSPDRAWELAPTGRPSGPRGPGRREWSRSGRLRLDVELALAGVGEDSPDRAGSATSRIVSPALVLATTSRPTDLAKWEGRVSLRSSPGEVTSS